jgi:hypothetical protein
MFCQDLWEESSNFDNLWATTLLKFPSLKAKIIIAFLLRRRIHFHRGIDTPPRDIFQPLTTGMMGWRPSAK